MKPAVPIILYACGLQSNLNRKLTHAPLYYGGENVFDLHSFSTSDSTKWILQGILNSKETTTNLFWITIGHHQIETGESKDIFKLKLKDWRGLYSESSITSLWKIISEYSAKINIISDPEISPVKERDKFIMQIIIDNNLFKRTEK